MFEGLSKLESVLELFKLRWFLLRKCSQIVVRTCLLPRIPLTFDSCFQPWSIVKYRPYKADPRGITWMGIKRPR